MRLTVEKTKTYLLQGLSSQELEEYLRKRIGKLLSTYAYIMR